MFKGGSKKSVENYRSLFPTMSKIFEKLIDNEIYPKLLCIILPQQHGFVQKRSTVTNLLSYTSHLFDAMDHNKQTECIHTDFRKAFDRVDHKIFLNKVAFNGYESICGDSLNRTLVV